MAEESERQGHATVAADGAGLAAMSLAMSAAAQNERVAAKAEAFLEKQGRLADLQIEELRKEDRIRHQSLRVRHINEVMKLAFSLAAATLATLAMVGIGWMVWQAHAAHGLVVEPMRAPPDYAARGLDGAVLSQRLLDNINALIAQTNNFTFGTGSTATASFGDDTKVEIPETGISLGELERELRRWLGNESHITGELWHTKSGIAIGVRSGAGLALTVKGEDGDIDALLGKAAYELIAQSQPLVYGGLFELKDPRKADRIYRAVAATTSGKEHMQALESLAGVLGQEGLNEEALFIGQQVNDSNNPGFYVALANANFALGWLKPAMLNIDRAVSLFGTVSNEDMSPAFAAALGASTRAWAAELRGDFSQAVREDRVMQEFNEWDFSQFGWEETASDEARDHDVIAAQNALTQHPGVETSDIIRNELSINYVLPPPVAVDIEQARWSLVSHDLALADRTALRAGMTDDVRHTIVWPWLSYAWAKTGNIRGADALIAMTPLDCVLCLEMRGRLADLKRNYSSAETWFDRAVNTAPSIPFAYTDWGAMLLHRGDYDGAIAKLTLANQKGPHFADPLEMWGEALMLENRSDLALEKFADANKYAPNWGRLHLKWGEALGYVGRKDEAGAQYRIASTLDMSVADKAELERDLRG